MHNHMVTLVKTDVTLRKELVKHAKNQRITSTIKLPRVNEN
jgi:hypothetical protein